jgi:glutamate-5-semialdehyde dehydrogenase
VLGSDSSPQRAQPRIVETAGTLGFVTGTGADLATLGRHAVAASRKMASASTAEKDEALFAAAELLESRSLEILAANSKDVGQASAAGATETELDRLQLSGQRITSMAQALRTIAGLPDPIGQVVEGYVRPNGLRVERVRVPLGVVGVIYENRPNVTSDCAGLCLKAGNAVMLRGSSSALNSNRAVVSCLRSAFSKVGLPEDSVILVEQTDRDSAGEFMRLDGVIDCLIPRGGASLIASVRKNATVPTVIDGDGNCHIYVDRSADLSMAVDIIVNAKTQRPSVCNAAESLLVHRDVASSLLPAVTAAMPEVSLVGDERAVEILPGIGHATEEDFGTEFLSLKMSIAVVDDLDSAIEHITCYGSGHSEAIVTTDISSANAFVQRVDAAAVVVNASTRFVDGGELGLGAEIGISTQKLHARGPMGLEALTCVKYVLNGEGHIR